MATRKYGKRNYSTDAKTICEGVVKVSAVATEFFVEDMTDSDIEYFDSCVRKIIASVVKAKGLEVGENGGKI